MQVADRHVYFVSRPDADTIEPFAVNGQLRTTE